MEGTKMFTCHLEAEEGQFPEYCIHDVCCGLYKQRSMLASIFWLLVCLAVILLTCYLIYLYILPNKENGTNSQQAPRTMKGQTENPRNGEKPNKQKPDSGAGKSNKVQEEEEDENEDDDDEEDDDNNDVGVNDVAYSNKNRNQNNQSSEKRDPNVDSGKLKSNEGKKEEALTDTKDKDSTFPKPQNTSPMPQKENSPKEDLQDISTNTSSADFRNGNVKITYIKEDYYITDECGTDENDEPKEPDSVKYLNVNYKHVDIKRNNDY